MDYYVYIISNRANTVFYIGVTNNLIKRIHEHKIGLVEGFSRLYRLQKLVYLETYSNIEEAIRREKQLKSWHRQWKINLIKRSNSKLKDLSLQF